MTKERISREKLIRNNNGEQDRMAELESGGERAWRI